MAEGTTDIQTKKIQTTNIKQNSKTGIKRKKRQRLFLKQHFTYLLVLFLGACCLLSGCADGIKAKKPVHLLNRENGSGTLDAFSSLFDISNPLPEAEVTNSTAIMIKTIEGDPGAVGYISMGSLDDSVAPLAIEGIEPSLKTIENGTYPVSRDFWIVIQAQSKSAQKEKQIDDFISYLNSDQAALVMEENGYAPVSDTSDASLPESSYFASKAGSLKSGSGSFTSNFEKTDDQNLSNFTGNTEKENEKKSDDLADFHSSHPAGTLCIGGSSSVSPIMEKLAEDYHRLNSDLKVEVQQSDSSTGISCTLDGTYDIGMSSRTLSEKELQSGLKASSICKDGIILIVNKSNPVKSLSKAQVKKLYEGKITSWKDLE